MADKLPLKQTVDRVGGVGSVLTGLVCGYIGWMDWDAERSIWKVWAFMCALLILNGIAMLLVARRAALKQ